MKMLNAIALVLGLVGAAYAQTAGEPGFLQQTGRAMDKMMADMSVAPSGDVDADFVAMMIPHHQGAIDMAQAELAFGRNELLRRIAQGIIVEQTQEIEAMHLASATPPSNAAASSSPEGHHQHGP